MDSMIASKVWRAATLGVLLLCGTGKAQEPPDLDDLIFEPMPLALARENPLPVEAGPRDGNRTSSRAARRREADVERVRRDGEPGSPELIEALALLAVAYQGLDRHEEALETLEEAIELTIDNSGRNNPEQIPLHEQKLVSFRALRDIGAIDDTEEHIYDLNERHHSPGSRSMYYATINLADWYTTAYYKENYGAGNTRLMRQRGVTQRPQRCIRVPGTAPSEDARSCEGNRIFTGEIKDVFTQDIIDSRLRKIDQLYTSFQKDLSDSGNVQLDIVIDIAKRVARLAYATKQEMDFERDNYAYDPNYEGSRAQAARNSRERLDASYLTGKRALEYAIDYPSSVAAFRPEALAASQLDLGDWHLAYGKAAAAQEAYRKAYDVLIEAGFTSSNVDRALATDLPIVIPVFATHLYTRRSNGLPPDTELEYRGYLDLSYTVDRLGNIRDLEWLGASSDDAREIERLLEIQFKSMKMRPSLVGGELESPGRVEGRYYYAY